ncbi:hypothetical protein ABT236_14745 [Streptomyces sp. NPDC001523]|uniref:hypothetical protein n=1 Tax=Streptomyces sp. NPDC001523 TaxID=3154383 RepID=UPI00331E1DEC
MIELSSKAAAFCRHRQGATGSSAQWWSGIAQLHPREGRGESPASQVGGEHCLPLIDSLTDRHYLVSDSCFSRVRAHARGGVPRHRREGAHEHHLRELQRSRGGRMRGIGETIWRDRMELVTGSPSVILSVQGGF